MIIEYRPDHDPNWFQAREPNPGSAHVVVDGLACRLCDHLVVLRRRDGLGVALTLPDSVEATLKAMEPEHGPLLVQPPDGNLYLQALTSVEGHNTITGRARCVRCYEFIGELRVTVSTIFGIAEDRAVLCGRPRVY